MQEAIVVASPAVVAVGLVPAAGTVQSHNGEKQKMANLEIHTGILNTVSRHFPQKSILLLSNGKG